MLCVALDAHGAETPLLDVRWTECSAEDLVSAGDVLLAAVDELGLSNS